MNKLLDCLHEKMLKSKFSEEVTEAEIDALVEAKEHNVGWISCSDTVELKQTWGNKIRAMSDEELADYLYKMTLASLTVVEVDSREIAIPKLLKWLQSEAE